MLEHLGKRLTDLVEETAQCSKVEDSTLTLGRARFPLQVMEPLIADKVIRVCPCIGECVAQSDGRDVGRPKELCQANLGLPRNSA